MQHMGCLIVSENTDWQIAQHRKDSLTVDHMYLLPAVRRGSLLAVRTSFLPARRTYYWTARSQTDYRSLRIAMIVLSANETMYSL